MESPKICGTCGANVEGRSRSKLPDGTYVCRKCMHDERRAAQRTMRLRRNLLWPAIVATLLGVFFVVLWATTRPPLRRR